MSEPITKRLNGIDLHQPGRGWRLRADSSARVARSVSRAPLVVGRRHGSVQHGRLPVYDEATVNLTWSLTASSSAELEQVYDDLLGVLSRPGLVYEHVVDGRVLQAPCELVSVSEPPVFVAGRLMSGVTASLALTDPFLREPELSTFGPVSAGTHVLPWGGTAPISDAIVRFTGPFSSVSLVDQASGTGLSYQGQVNSGQYLYLEANTLVARVSASASAWVSGGTNVSGGLDYPGSGRLQLWPVTTQVPGAVVARNRTHNGGGEVAGWASTIPSSWSGARDSDRSRSGAWSYRTTRVGSPAGSAVISAVVIGPGNPSAPGPATSLPVPAGATQVHGLAHVFIETAAPPLMRGRLRVIFYNSAGTAVGSEQYGAYTDIGHGKWVPVRHTWSVPEGAVAYRWGVETRIRPGEDGAVLGQQVWYDDAVSWTDLDPHVTDFFNGATPDVGGSMYEWEGAVNASPSVRRVATLGRASTIVATGAQVAVRARGAFL